MRTARLRVGDIVKVKTDIGQAPMYLERTHVSETEMGGMDGFNGWLQRKKMAMVVACMPFDAKEDQILLLVSNSNRLVWSWDAYFEPV